MCLLWEFITRYDEIMVCCPALLGMHRFNTFVFYARTFKSVLLWLIQASCKLDEMSKILKLSVTCSERNLWAWPGPDQVMGPPQWCSPVRREPAAWHFSVVQPVSLPALNAVFINLNQVLWVPQLDLRSSCSSPHSLSPPCRPFRPQSPAVEVLSHSAHVFLTCTHLLSCSVSLYPKENLIQAKPVRSGQGLHLRRAPCRKIAQGS